MQEIIEKTNQLEQLSNEPTTKINDFLTSYAPKCLVCGTYIEYSNDRTCSVECAEIHAYEMAEAEATGN